MTAQRIDAEITGSVHIIGSGLLGASIGLALRLKNIPVTLADTSPTALALAVDYGAGVAVTQADSHPQLVIAATPPEHTAEVVAAALKKYPGAVVTDVASVKLAPLQRLQELGADLSRYVGSHPMAGRERGSAIMARADLFVARPWVVCAEERTDPAALQLVRNLALAVSAVPTEWRAADHDSAVAAVSHLPQVVASLTAAQLVKTAQQNLALAGSGLRDTVRIASSDPELWVQILTANSAPVVSLLEGLQHDLGEIIAALKNGNAAGARGKLAATLAAGGAGAARIPGKHGGSNRFALLSVIIADKPGQLAKLFTDLEELKVNMEDIRLEHSPGAQIGFAEISVLPELRDDAVAGLEARGWRIV